MSHVLLVTPLPVDQQLCAALLETGYTLAVAHDCTLARQKAQHQPPLIAILNLDIQEEKVQALVQWLKNQKATLVLVTANTTEERTIALQAGADELLTYPLETVEVQCRLQTLATGQRLPPGGVESFLGSGAADILGNVDLLSHDIKSPLGIIISSLELVRDFQSTGLAKDDPDAILEARLSNNALLASYRLLNLINDMVDFIKIERQAYPISIYPQDFPALVHHVLATNATAIESKGITLEVAYPHAFPEVSGDAELIGRIIMVLLDNSLKFTSQGQQIGITFNTQGNTALLQISDTGRPILPDYAATVFARAGQWEARQNGGRSSIAWGLPFAHTAVQLLGGDLTATTDLPTRTTTFTLRLPLYD